MLIKCYFIALSIELVCADNYDEVDEHKLFQEKDSASARMSFGRFYELRPFHPKKSYNWAYFKEQSMTMKTNMGDIRPCNRLSGTFQIQVLKKHFPTRYWGVKHSSQLKLQFGGHETWKFYPTPSVEGVNPVLIQSTFDYKKRKFNPYRMSTV